METHSEHGGANWNKLSKKVSHYFLALIFAASLLAQRIDASDVIIRWLSRNPLLFFRSIRFPLFSFQISLSLAFFHSIDGFHCFHSAVAATFALPFLSLAVPLLFISLCILLIKLFRRNDIEWYQFSGRRWSRGARGGAEVINWSANGMGVFSECARERDGETSRGECEPNQRSSRC